jgi:ribosome biogenesis GTPase A
MKQTFINHEKMSNLFEKSTPKTLLAEGKDGVLVIGNTGAGKSTLINYLLGCKMGIKREHGRDIYETQGQYYAMIGHKFRTS